jgi:hypothetical protein
MAKNPDEPDIIPLEAFIAADAGTGRISPNPEMLPSLHEAEIIFGVDVMTGHRFLLYGRAQLKRIAETGIEEMAPVLYIGLDQETDELEKVVIIVEVVKGECDYIGSDDEPESH